jgi:hypothetical protein
VVGRERLGVGDVQRRAPQRADLQRRDERVRENVERFAAGEPLLGVVDVAAGY